MLENLIESRRGLINYKQKRERERERERVSIMGVPHYSDIYTFDPDGGRWDKVVGRWVHYEGYGRGKEKTDFMESINGQHELWKTQTKLVTPTEIIPYSSPEKRNPKKVQFVSSINKRVVENFCNDMSDEYHYDTTHAIDGSDRADRASANFQQMLADYAEKAWSKELKEGFFAVGGLGRKWGENMDFVSYFTEKFLEIDEKLNEDKAWKISLTGQTVKDYPRSHYHGVRDRFFTYNRDRINAGKGRVSSLRATAPVFVPIGANINVPQVVGKVPGLQRCGAAKICGVYKVDSPVRKIPRGPPPPRRPSASTRNSTRHLTWEQKEEHERDFEELSNKLDKIATFQ
jgi:hypothetical protein